MTEDMLLERQAALAALGTRPALLPTHTLKPPATSCITPPPITSLLPSLVPLSAQPCSAR